MAAFLYNWHSFYQEKVRINIKIRKYNLNIR